ncbi:hypothetical protein E5676_scaffold190G00350 [Cucumis melo var. makuwa]|uniref:Uncharacterized protein n=1 Tax=Cucumis melo var. makuwa TaxID=1194695 RepID=A0A5D3DQW6_CUCMM|nr:hypothetical protein E6C27_scaffold1164G00030 [Cucumis melo var. makuwa]TYK25938.1 hypothetical protein E5676_scaffold190G00350 [Cucumis melo var. makuwa]
MYIITQQTLCPTQNTYWQSIAELQQTKVVYQAPGTRSLPGKWVKHFGKGYTQYNNVYKLYDVVGPVQHSRQHRCYGVHTTSTTESNQCAHGNL